MFDSKLVLGFSQLSVDALVLKELDQVWLREAVLSVTEAAVCGSASGVLEQGPINDVVGDPQPLRDAMLNCWCAKNLPIRSRRELGQ